MLLKCCTQYACTYGKLSTGHRTDKGQFSFQSQRKAMPKNLQTIVQFYSFHILARKYSKSFELGFQSTWTKNVQMFKLDLEKAEEPEIKLPTCTGSSKKQESSRKNILLLYWLCQKLWLCGSQQTVENSSRYGNIRPSYLPPRNLYAGQEATVRTGHGTTDCSQIGKGVHQAVYSHPAYLTYMQSTSCEMLGSMKHKLESQFLGEISITSDMQMTPPLWQKVNKI